MEGDGEGDVDDPLEEEKDGEGAAEDDRRGRRWKGEV